MLSNSARLKVIACTNRQYVSRGASGAIPSHKTLVFEAEPLAINGK
jgi:hypothetical protein